MKSRRNILKIGIIILFFIMMTSSVYAVNDNGSVDASKGTNGSAPVLSISNTGVSLGTSTDPKDVSSSIQIVLLLTVLSLAPSLLIMMTSFTRIIIVLSFLRNALGTQQMPPNQVLVGLALFLTFFIMSPVLTQINDQAFQPYVKGQITDQQVALDKSSQIIKTWMVKQIFSNKRTKDLELFVSLAEIKTPIKSDEAYKLPITVVAPAFMISELTVAFKFGFMVFLPFLVIDMVVASTLMSMGMMMLPPVMISLPFKILLFILVDGWGMVIQSLINSFAK